MKYRDIFIQSPHDGNIHVVRQREDLLDVPCICKRNMIPTIRWAYCTRAECRAKVIQIDLLEEEKTLAAG